MSESAAFSRELAHSWSVEAMNAAADRVNKIPATDTDLAFAAFGEAVWWITVVNDALAKRYPEAYAAALKFQTPRVEETIAGLRSVRHRIAHEVDLFDFITPVGSRPDYYGDGRITAWCWKSVGPPTRSDSRDVEGHKAYETAVAGQNVVHIFTFALSFLRQVHSLAQSPPSS